MKAIVLKRAGSPDRLVLADVPADGILAHIPSKVGYEEAAPIPVGAMTALHFLQAGNAGPGTRVLINGASGSTMELCRHTRLMAWALSGFCGRWT